jgi:ATP-binding cassette subfamily B protein
LSDASEQRDGREFTVAAAARGFSFRAPLTWWRSLFADPYGTLPLARRVFVEEGSRHWRSYLASFALMTVVAACTAFSAYLVGHLVNATYLTRSFTAVILLSGLTIVIYLVKGLATYGQSILAAWIGADIAARNQQLMFDKLLREQLGYFAGRPSSLVMSQVAYGAHSTAAVLDMLVNSIGRDALSLVGLGTVMVVQDPLLSCVALVILPPALLTAGQLVRKAQQMSGAQFMSGANLMETVQETLQGLRVVKAFGLEGLMRRRVASSIEITKRAAIDLAKVSNRSSPLMETLGGIALAVAFLYGGYRVIAMDATAGELVSFTTAFLLAYEPGKRLIRARYDLVMNIYGARMLYQLLDTPATEPDDNDKPALHVGPGRIEFSGVAFAYRQDEPALRDISFVAEAGRVTALVGGSGAGKSTIFSLLLRFYEPQSGAIFVDGQNITAVSHRSLRGQIAFVSQDVFLFRATIAENIAIGRPDASEDEVVAAARAAYAHDFIVAFPKGYDTQVGEHGLDLSAGERQRIAVARALLRNASIILLDEPTAALDAKSESEVQRAIAELCAGRTTLVIAHRLHTVVDAARIYVIEKGRVVEDGRHGELLARVGQYAAYYRLHFGDDARRLS